MIVSEGERMMSARDKLNAAFFNGSLFIAGLAGLATASWGTFIGALLGLLVVNVALGHIRPRGR
jgi:hypothetical protein